MHLHNYPHMPPDYRHTTWTGKGHWIPYHFNIVTGAYVYDNIFCISHLATDVHLKPVKVQVS